jgi:hypothetical protein
MERILLSPKQFNLSICGFALPLIIILGAMLLATYWVFLVPIFQEPDEDRHADYIFSLYSRGRIIQAKEAPLVGCSHPFISYLLKMTNGQAVKFSASIKMPPDYGTAKFFNRININAPDERVCAQNITNPFVVAMYPIAYYALTASYLKLISYLDNDLTFLFFAGRFLSVILLGCGLTFAYLSMRELGLSYTKSLLILTAIGFFPMVTMVGSYLQPDNLTFVVVNACFFFALRWRNITLQRPVGLYSVYKDWIIWSLAGSLTLLSLIKYQFFWCTGLAVIAMIIAVMVRRRFPLRKTAEILATIFIPLAIANIPQLWIFWGCHLPVLENKWIPDHRAFLRAYNAGWDPFVLHVYLSLCHECRGLYSVLGSAFTTFWGKFGWASTNIPLIIESQHLNDALLELILLTTKIILTLTLVSLAGVVISLLRLLKRKRFRDALYYACSNPVINSYFLFVVFFFLFDILVYPSCGWEGRHWFPFLLAIVISATCFAPRVLSFRRIKNAFFFVTVIGWICYSIVGSYYAIGCIHKRFYEADTALHINLEEVKPTNLNTVSHIESFDFVDPIPTLNVHANNLVVPKGAYLRIRGWAVDIVAGAPATAVLFYIDHSKTYEATFPLDDWNAVDALHNQVYQFSGFDGLIPTTDLLPGCHYFSMKVLSKDKRLLYNTDVNIKFTVVNN